MAGRLKDAVKSREAGFLNAKRFTAEGMVKDYVKVYEEILNNHNMRSVVQ